MVQINIVVILALICAASTKPVDQFEGIESGTEVEQAHDIQKRFVNPSLTSGDFSVVGFNKLRTKRSEDECEKLRLCELHARANRNFFAAFELYFVNRENARLWDHQAHSRSDCEQRFSCYR